MKVESLTGIDLDKAVAALEGVDAILNMMTEPRGFRPSTDWAQGGPIIEREKIDIRYVQDGELEFWAADVWVEDVYDSRGNKLPSELTLYGPTPLIAAMRGYVKSRIGVRRKG